MIYGFFSFIYRFLAYAHSKHSNRVYRRRYKLPVSVFINKEALLIGDHISIGEHTYINGGLVQSGTTASISIGAYCAIGRNVNIVACTHDPEQPTGPGRPLPQADIVIGNYVWIGSNVFISVGVTVGDNVVIGANSVVTKDIPANAIYGGVPARLIRMKRGFEETKSFLEVDQTGSA